MRASWALQVFMLWPCASGLRLPAPFSSTTSDVVFRTALLNRRTVLLGASGSAAFTLLPVRSVSAKATESELIGTLRSAATALEPLPGLLDEEKWDAVRSVLKTPPVGLLWNLGESKNTIRMLATLRDDVELFEAADEIAGALQLADQFTYDNNFIYYQPGNGKVKIKEPKQQVVLARSKIKSIVETE